MKRLILFIYFIVFGNLAHQFEDSNIVIKNPIIKLNYSDADIAAGYFRIENNSDSTISFMAIKSDIADIQEIHEVVLEDNIYKMRPVKSGLEINPNSSLDFKPKSYHIMFYKIKKSFLSEEMVEAKLLFNSNIIIDVEFKVVVGNSHHSH